MSGLLDLSGADTSGFEAIDAGSYDATVFDTEVVETSGNSKLPAGVPMAKVQFSIQDEGGKAHNRRIFGYFPIPTAEQSENASIMQGNFVKFLVALGEDEKKIKSKGFDLVNLTDLEGKACVIRVGYEPDKREGHEGEFQNPLKGVKPEGSPTGTSTAAASSDLL